MGLTVKNIFHVTLFMLFVFSIEAAQEVKFKPTKYDIHIVTKNEDFEKSDSEDVKYDGIVQIEMERVSQEDPKEDFFIVLNINPKMELKKTKVTDLDGPNKDIEHKPDHKDVTLTINFAKDLASLKKLLLRVEFSNPYGKDMTGFYRSSYENSEKKTSWLLTTHFEPIFARNAFPCFDQPDLKAKFKISITAPKSVGTVLSNTEIDNVDNSKDPVIYHFKETNIPISTYLVAFTVSDFKSTKPVEFDSKYDSNDKKKKLLTYGRKQVIDNGEGEFAQSVAKEAVEKLTEYLKTGYALKKIDQVGIPDFSAGAMENFGHISFREKSLFYNDKTSTTMTKQSNLLTIVHELVHQWFGNLVTLEKWDYIWLNEAFATYLEYVIGSQLKISENWNLMEQLVVDEIQARAFETDGLNSKPLTNKINENQIFASFNDIPYSKGAAVLRMWDLSFGKDKFKNSLGEYIKDRKEKTANPDQLYDKLKSFMANKEVFEKWTTKAGYPVVEVKRENQTYKLTQSRFSWEKLEKDETKWPIPITYSTNKAKNFSETEASVWMSNNTAELQNVEGNWIIINNQQAGYYRVSYQKENWQALSEALKKDKFDGIPELSRAQLINDVFSLARSLQKDYVSYSTALKLTEYLVNETSYLPLKTALKAYDFLLPKLSSNAVSNKFKSYVLNLIKPHYKNLTSTAEKHVDKLKKVEISRWACALDLEDCLKQSKDLYNASKHNEYPDIQEIVLCTVVRTNKNAWDDIFKKYQGEQDSALKVMYLTALGCTSDSTIAKEFLKKTLNDDSGIRKQDLIFALSAVYNGNLNNVEVAFKFVEENFKKIAARYGGIDPLGRVIVGIAKKLNTKEQHERLTKLVENVKSDPAGAGSEENLKNALEIAKSNLNWNKQRASQFGEYFSGSSSLVSSLSLVFMCLLFLFRL